MSPSLLPLPVAAGCAPGTQLAINGARTWARSRRRLAPARDGALARHVLWRRGYRCDQPPTRAVAANAKARNRGLRYACAPPPCGMLERANGHQPARACGGGTRSHSAKQWTRVGAAGTAACGAATTPHGSFRTLPISRGPKACRAKGALLDRDVAVRRFNRMASPYLHGSWLVLPIPSRYRAGFPSDVEPANGDPP